MSQPALDVRLSQLVGDKDVILSDVWGVVHNGVVAHPAAGEALANFRAKGGTVVMISNAPRPADQIEIMFAKLGVRRDAWDAIVTSGDVTRTWVREQAGQRIHHIGPERDAPVFAGTGVELSSLERASAAVCTGLFDDETETPDDYAEQLAVMHARDMLMVCANPDIVVERGNKLIWCAGAIAQRYEEMGGRVMWCGKPHGPIYDLALKTAAGLRGGETPHERVLAIGDAMRTDILGAMSQNIDALFLASGIHGHEVMRAGKIDAEAYATLLNDSGGKPVAAAAMLNW